MSDPIYSAIYPGPQERQIMQFLDTFIENKKLKRQALAAAPR